MASCRSIWEIARILRIGWGWMTGRAAKAAQKSLMPKTMNYAFAAQEIIIFIFFFPFWGGESIQSRELEEF